MILEYGYGVGVRRAMQDIDSGIIVSDWDQYQRLSDRLVKFHNFSPGEEKQRLRFKDRVPVDIILFGSIVDENNHISWPPDHETSLNVLGFDEAYDNAHIIRLRSDPLLDMTKRCSHPTPEHKKRAVELISMKSNLKIPKIDTAMSV